MVIREDGEKFVVLWREQFQNWTSAKHELIWNLEHHYTLNFTTGGLIDNLSYLYKKFWD